MNARDENDKLTERARNVLRLAQEEAQRFNHPYIGTEHLLLGLLREEEGAGVQVLKSLGADLNQVRSSVEFIIRRGDPIGLGPMMLFTPRARKVINLAADEARQLNHPYIGTEHLLLGLVRQGDGIAAGVLESLGIGLEKVRAQVVQTMELASPATDAPRIGLEEIPPELRETVQALEAILNEKEAAILQQNYEGAAELHGREIKLRERIVKFITSEPEDKDQQPPT